MRAKAKPPLPFPRQFEGAEAEWKKLLAEHAFKDVDKAFRVLREFVEGPGIRARVAAHDRTGASIDAQALCALSSAERGDARRPEIGAGMARGPAPYQRTAHAQRRPRSRSPIPTAW